MKIERCRTNHMKNPLGFQFVKPIITWWVTETNDKKQETARIVVALDEKLEQVIFDTGKGTNVSCLGTEIPVTLSPFTRYFWQVSVWGNSGDTAKSQIQWFETGHMDAKWNAEWITPGWEDNEIHPYMRRTFHLEQPVRSARAYVAGVGMYELELNGKRVGDEYFAPGCTVYESRIQNYTYDITSMLRYGENAIGALLGNGWAKGRFGVFGPAVHTAAIDRFGILVELRITLLDGQEVMIGSDTGWRCISSPIIADGLYDGEVYDSRKEITDWSMPGYTDTNWDMVKIWQPKLLGKVEDRLSLPVRKKEQIVPISLIRTKSDEWILDMGQNFVGWLQVRVKEPYGTKIKLSYGEVLQEDCFYNENLRSAKQEYTYIANGIKQVTEPHFVFYGFRYVKLEGFSLEPDIADFTGYAIYSDLEETGWIETSDPLVNRLFENAKWSQKGNFVDVPTDCPQRDERMGWTGDAQVFSETASYNMETYEFYTKYMQDIWDEQKPRGGMVGNIVPTFMKKKMDTSDPLQGGAAAWGDSAVIIPWRLYLHYGDITILRRQYESMKAWVDWIHRQDQADGGEYLWRTGSQLGDWLALDGKIEGGTQGGTDKVYIASAYYSYSADLVSKSANLLGLIEDAIYYQEMSGKVKMAIQKEYFSPNGRLTLQTQTAYVLALYMELIPEQWKERIVEDLARQVEADNMHLTTGFVGTPYLCRVLSRYGYSDHAYRIFFQEDFPGWLYEIKMGATTIWERWNSILPDGRISDTGMNSLNHYAYGSIVEWMYQSVCGLQIDDKYPGFKHFVIKPHLCGRLKYTDLTYHSPAGCIKSRWERKDNMIQMNLHVPFDTEAMVYLPYPKPETIIGLDIGSLQSSGDGYQYIELLAGDYEISYETQYDISEYYSFEHSIKDMLAVPEAADAMYDLMDRIGIMPRELAPDQEKPLCVAFDEMDPVVLEHFKEVVDTGRIEQKLKMIPVRRKIHEG